MRKREIKGGEEKGWERLEWIMLGKSTVNREWQSKQGELGIGWREVGNKRKGGSKRNR